MSTGTGDTGSTGEWDPGDLSGLQTSTHAFLRSVDALSPEELAAPSLLPRWSRAHVVAHVALHGFAMAGVLDALGRGGTGAMYPSDQQRDADIDELVAAGPDELRHRVLASTTRFADQVEAMPRGGWEGAYNRLPEGPTWPAVTIVATRRREVEVHHTDLGLSYAPQDWPEDFVVELLDAVTVDHAGSGPFGVRATDLGRDWTVGGDGGPTVMGAGSDLGRWLTGRSDGEGLSCDAEAFPRLGPWQRASATAVRTPES